MIDLLVAGGGPVGLATALYAHRAGLTVAVAEPRRGSIDKACGEGLMPGAVTALAELGIEPPGQVFRGIRYVEGARRAEARFAQGSGLGVRRTTLHAAMREAVDAAGISVHPVRVEAISQDAHSVRAASLHARYLAAADGLHSPLRRELGLEKPCSGPARFGLRGHFAAAPWADVVEVHWSREAEAYVTPVAPDLVGVAILTSRRAPLGEHLRAFPALVERLSCESVTKVRGASPLRQRSSRRVAGRVLLVGDAAGYVDALTGEG
ncbi:MAG: NAD(P)/FAD-dependent oxidoreductase, partial [Nocardioidaceae bacterium]